MPHMNHNISRTHGFEPLRIEGNIPDQLRGTLYRVGPGLVRKFGKDVHPFLADGLITSVDISSNPTGACELVKDEKFQEEERAGRSLYDMNASGLRRLYNGLTGKVKNTGNTNVLSWQDQLFALMEQGHPVKFDAENLASIGSSDLGMIHGSFSAHPHRVDSLKTTFNFGVQGRKIHVYALPDLGAASKIFTIDVPWAGLVHDFIVTETSAVFFIDPAKLVIWRAVLGLKEFSKYFHWDASESTTAVIVPFASPEDQTRVEVDPFRVWHFANAYDDGDDVVVDAFRHKNIDVLTSPTILAADVPVPELCRFRISRKTGTMDQEKLSKSPSEFPAVNPLVLGHKHRFVWMQTYDDDQRNQGFSVFDTATAKMRRYSAPDNHLVSEPMLVPSGPNEKDVWILQLTQDTVSKQSYLGVFAADRFEDGPLAKLWFDHAIPSTFHGTFVPSKPDPRA